MSLELQEVTYVPKIKTKTKNQKINKSIKKAITCTIFLLIFVVVINTFPQKNAKRMELVDLVLSN